MELAHIRWRATVFGALRLSSGGPYFTWRFVRTSSFVGPQILGQARTIGNPCSIDCFLSSLPRCFCLGLKIFNNQPGKPSYFLVFVLPFWLFISSNFNHAYGLFSCYQYVVTHHHWIVKSSSTKLQKCKLSMCSLSI